MRELADGEDGLKSSVAVPCMQDSPYKGLPVSCMLSREHQQWSCSTTVQQNGTGMSLLGSVCASQDFGRESRM